MTWETIEINNQIKINKNVFKITINQSISHSWRISFNSEFKTYLSEKCNDEDIMKYNVYYKPFIDIQNKLIGIKFLLNTESDCIPVKMRIDRLYNNIRLSAYCTNMINTIIDKCGKIDTSKMKAIPVEKDKNDDNLLIFSFEPYIIK